MDMRWKYGLAALLPFVLSGSQVAFSAPVTPVAKSTLTVKPAPKVAHKSPAARKYHYKTYFVPPPPAYMPSLVPSMMSPQDQATLAESDEKKPENPYKKYFQTPQSDVPNPIQTRKGVVIWAQRS